MRPTTVIKLLAAGVLLLITIIFITLDNEIIYPASLVAFLLVLTFLETKKYAPTPTANASRIAITVFSLLVILANIFVPLLLPGMLTNTDFSHHNFEMTSETGTKDPQALRQHFIEVTNNDMHELCYFTGILLLLHLIFLAGFNLTRKKSPTLAS